MDFDLIIKQLADDKLMSFALPLFALAIAIELIIAWRKRLKLYQGRDSLTSLLMLVASTIVDFAPKVLAFGGFVILHELSPLKDVIGRQWWAWALLFFLDDFTYYWFHRANHQVRLLWAGHVSHHSSQYLNLGTALRQGVGERLHKYLFWLWLPLLGFDAVMIFTIIGINLFYQFWVHTELVKRLPSFFEAIFNTPSHHRVHHASNIRYLDCNHAGVLIIWDKMFGTFSPESPDEAVIYGLTTNIDTYNPFKVALGEYLALWRDVGSAKTLADKLRYILLAPGWSHQGPDKRAASLRRT